MMKQPITVLPPKLRAAEEGGPRYSFDFDALKISVASPEQMLSWSYGEVTKPETINYRTQKPERDGLFDERIFGPTRDWQCYCGKYKKVRFKGIICDKCGVEVTRSSVRRERMGHIDLAVPVAHIWYVRGVPSAIGTILDLSVVDLERVIYFAGFLIQEVNEDLRKRALSDLEAEYKQSFAEEGDLDRKEAITAAYRTARSELAGLSPLSVISEARYHDLSLKYGSLIKVGIGAEAILEVLKSIDLGKLEKELISVLPKAEGTVHRRLARRLKQVQDMKKAKLRPDWFVWLRLPVLPPDLRPMVQLDGGRFAASDLNDLYRRVINRNNRLKKLLSQGAPEVILRNEKRMLQEAVDALIDNQARRGRAAQAATATQRKLRSLSDMLRGKQGRFRQNLLGKRVDYSGRSVIVVGPELKLNQCGLPKVMALELFKPFVISRLINEGYVHNVKNAGRLIERGTPEVWDILEEITKNYYVLLNRAPTLHRLGIQAFQPILIEGKALQIHPLVCHAYNADFDGDQMAVHIPLSRQARFEAEEMIRSTKNLLKPASGDPIVTPRLEMILGLFVLTSPLPGARGEKKAFASEDEAIHAYESGAVHLRAPIIVRVSTKNGPERLETTAGRILFNEILPGSLRFVNETLTTGIVKKLAAISYKELGPDVTATLVDGMKKLGFTHATLSGTTFSISDVIIPSEKQEIIARAKEQLETIEKQYTRGFITESERRAQTVALWTKTKEEIEQKMVSAYDSENPVFMTIASGARGSISQLTQLGGMKGLVVNPAGEIIEQPVISNIKEGLDVLEYFNSTHGARKGKSDTSLRTSDAGYLTRRLVDVAQDIAISEEDCGTKAGLIISREESKAMNQKFSARVVGRFAARDVSLGKKILVPRNEIITPEIAGEIEESEIPEVEVRSTLTCESEWGVCVKCYGFDLSRNEVVKIGEVVGIMAAQAIGEPGTQLTMKTFHLGGVAGEDITQGLPRVEELFEARSPRTPALLSEIKGKVSVKEEKEKLLITVSSSERESREYILPEGFKWGVADGEVVKPRQAIATAKDEKALRSDISGKVAISGKKLTVNSIEPLSKTYAIPSPVPLRVKNGELVERGAQLTEGHLDLDLSLSWNGKLSTQKYIIKDVQEIYASQGQVINDKHIELIVSRMFSKVRILDPGDSDYLSGQIEGRKRVEAKNRELKGAGKKLILYDDTILGVTRVALKTDSFLSAASFQETTGVLIDAAVRGAVDYLRGLKENVIIGKLIPAGTAFRKPKVI
jgi:DNA-directed RNA polymerase subunit beta'